MYGSQFQTELAMNSNCERALSNVEHTKNAKTGSIFTIILAIALFSLSMSSFAGPKEPRLPGGNGNSRGR